MINNTNENKNFIKITKELNIKDNLQDKFIDYYLKNYRYISKDDYTVEEWKEFLETYEIDNYTEIIFYEKENFDWISMEMLIENLQEYIFYTDEMYNRNWEFYKIKREKECNSLFERIIDNTMFKQNEETDMWIDEDGNEYEDIYELDGIVVYSNDEWDF